MNLKEYLLRRQFDGLIQDCVGECVWRVNAEALVKDNNLDGQ
jgi:hypothetical protein